MTDTLEDLITTIHKQCSFYEELIQFALQKKVCIINNETDKLRELNRSENSVINKNNKLEQARLEFSKRLADRLNIKPEELKLSFLIEFYKDKPEAEKLILLKNRITDTLTELKDINDINKSLIDNALDYIDFSMNVIRSSQSTTYLAADGSDICNDRSFFDTKS